MNVKYDKIIAREVLDSRANPTVEAEIWLDNGARATGMVPSGASTGIYEAKAIIDGDDRYMGKGVNRAVKHVCKDINKLFEGKYYKGAFEADRLMIEADGSNDKKNFGANAILAVSIANIKAGAMIKNMPLYSYIGGVNARVLPVPMLNVINGGAHAASSGLDTQEFMIMPVGAKSFREGLRMSTEVYHVLSKILKEKGFSTAVGDEGGFAPALKSDEEAIAYLLAAIKKAGYKAGREYGREADFMIALDAAASEWVQGKKEGAYGKGAISYVLPKAGTSYSSRQLIEHWKELVDKYPIVSIEDPLFEEDWDGWKEITRELGDKVQLVGDDLFVTNTSRLSKGIKTACANSILIKLNQIGSVSETIEAIEMAKNAGYTAIVSHRSGETEDTTIADLSVALNCGQIKTGAPSRSERTAKYNRLLRIEEELGDKAVYAGFDAFRFKNIREA